MSCTAAGFGRQEQEGRGTKVVARPATGLKTAFPSRRGFSRRNLKYVHKLVPTWAEPMVQQPVAQSPWSHVALLLDKLRTRPELGCYVSVVDQPVLDPERDDATVGFLIGSRRMAQREPEYPAPDSGLGPA
ncbi:DUF1016 N-terminal domain-containing protein [Streptomyces sp. NPDC047525]|uniref:DUF1016 N-terminal domain-containing protein n=1 Tax=Streptomyces sp. NPDC047525 TaxID=3155264 RepID=UPI0033E6F537